MAWTAAELAAACGGTLHGAHDASVGQVSTDTRRLAEGTRALFVGLRGATFDGDDFAPGALRSGAVGVLVHQGRVPELGERQFAIEVDDTLFALGELARHHLSTIGAKVVAITGSNGKTTTKEMTAAALAPYGSVLKNPGNHNNRIGMPLAALRATPGLQYAVFEIGMSEFGEIDRLTQICDPDVGVVVSIGAAHLDGVGSIDGVIKAKGELYRGLRPDAVAVIAADDAQVQRAAEGTAAEIVHVGQSAREVQVGKVRRRGVAGLAARITVDGRAHELELRTLARHDLNNAALAVGVLRALGLDPAAGIRALERHTGVGGRGGWMVMRGINVIDDTYNANPSSVASALRTLGEVAGGARRIAVLGDMLELGEHSSVLHREIGELAADMGIDVLYAVGSHNEDVAAGFYGEKVVCADDAVEIIDHLLQVAQPGDWVLVKGSRGMRMERVVNALEVGAEERA